MLFWAGIGIGAVIGGLAAVGALVLWVAWLGGLK